MIKKIKIKSKKKSICLFTFDPENKSDIAFVTLRGISVAPDPIQLSKSSLDYDLSQNLMNLGHFSCSFNWFATSVANKKYENLFIDEYSNEIEIVLNFLEKNYNFKKFVFITNSFGSLPVINFIKKNKRFNILNVIYQGPVLKSAVGSLKWRIKQDYAIQFKLLKKERNITKKSIKLIEDYKINSSDFDLSSFNIESIVFIGEFENDFRIKEVEDFCKINNYKKIISMNSGHTVYWANDRKVENINQIEKEIHDNIIQNILKLVFKN